MTDTIINLENGLGLNFDTIMMHADRRIAHIQSSEDQQVVMDSIIDEVVERFDSAAPRGQKFDAATAAEKLFQQSAIIRQNPEQKFSAYELFGMNNDVALGVDNYEIVRNTEYGEAAVWKDGINIPAAGVGTAKSTANVRYLVSSYSVNIFDEYGERFRPTNLAARKAKAAVNMIYNKSNKLFWGIDAERHGVTGIFNNKYVVNVEASVNFSRSNVESDPEAALAQLHRLADYAVVERGTDYPPDTFISSPRINAVISQIHMSGAGAQPTILERFMKERTEITTWKTAPELKNIDGVVNYDGILFTRGDDMGIKRVAPLAVQAIPMVSRDLASGVINIASNGGVVIGNADSNLLARFNIG